MDTVLLLHVKIHSISKDELRQKISEFLRSQTQHVIATPNPEFLLEAEKDEEFRKILNHADLAIADGVGLFFAGLLYGKWIKRNTGADIFLDLLHIAEKEGRRVSFVSLKQGLSSKEAIIKAAKEKFPKLEIFGVEVSADEIFNNAISYNTYNIAIEAVQKFQPELLFVGFGQGKQEKWINQHLKSFPSVRIAMGVGGSLDYLTGAKKRAPYILRRLGLEWLWRVFLQQKHVTQHLTAGEGERFVRHYPKSRFKRILGAAIVFPLKIVYDRIKHSFRHSRPAKRGGSR